MCVDDLNGLGSDRAPDFWKWLALFVRDEARGMSYETKDRLFERIEFKVKDLVWQAEREG